MSDLQSCRRGERPFSVCHGNACREIIGSISGINQSTLESTDSTDRLQPPMHGLSQDMEYISLLNTELLVNGLVDAVHFTLNVPLTNITPSPR